MIAASNSGRLFANIGLDEPVFSDCVTVMARYKSTRSPTRAKDDSDFEKSSGDLAKSSLYLCFKVVKRMYSVSSNADLASLTTFFVAAASFEDFF